MLLALLAVCAGAASARLAGAAGAAAPAAAPAAAAARRAQSTSCVANTQPIYLGETLLESVYSLPGSPCVSQRFRAQCGAAAALSRSPLPPPYPFFFLSLSRTAPFPAAPPFRPYSTYQTFSFTLPGVAAGGISKFRISVSGLSPGGNVDVFVGSDSMNNLCPNSTNYQYASTNAPPLAQVIDITNSKVGSTFEIWYIGVTGFTSGANLFSISILDPTQPQPLAPGIPVDGMVSPAAPSQPIVPIYYATNFSLIVRGAAASPPRGAALALQPAHHSLPLPCPPPRAPVLLAIPRAGLLRLLGHRGHFR